MKLRLDLSKVQVSPSNQEELQQISKITDDEWTFRLKLSSERGLTWNERLNSLLQGRVANIFEYFRNLDNFLERSKKLEESMLSSYYNQGNLKAKTPTPTPTPKKLNLPASTNLVKNAITPKFQIKNVAQSQRITNVKAEQQRVTDIKKQQIPQKQKKLDYLQQARPFTPQCTTTTLTKKAQKAQSGHISQLQNGIKRSEFLLNQISKQCQIRIQKKESVKVSQQETDKEKQISHLLLRNLSLLMYQKIKSRFIYNLTAVFKVGKQTQTSFIISLKQDPYQYYISNTHFQDHYFFFQFVAQLSLVSVFPFMVQQEY